MKALMPKEKRVRLEAAKRKKRAVRKKPAGARRVDAVAMKPKLANRVVKRVLRKGHRRANKKASASSGCASG